MTGFEVVDAELFSNSLNLFVPVDVSSEKNALLDNLYFTVVVGNGLYGGADDWLVCINLSDDLLADEVVGVCHVCVVRLDVACISMTASWLAEVLVVDNWFDASIVVAGLLGCKVLPGDSLVDPVVIDVLLGVRFSFLLCGTWLLSVILYVWLADATVSVWVEIIWVVDKWTDDSVIVADLLVWIVLPVGRLFVLVVVGGWLNDVLLFGN